AVVGVGAPVEDACWSKSGIEPPRARVEILEPTQAAALRAQRRKQSPAAGTGRRDEHVVHLLRSITLFRVAVLLAVPEALPAPVLPCVGVRRLVVSAVDADGRHDADELAHMIDPNVVYVAELIRRAVAREVHAQELTVPERHVQRGSKRARVH